MDRGVESTLAAIKLICQIGETLYGARWQSDLARELGVTPRTMRRWVAGHNLIPDEIWPMLFKLCDERAWELRDLGRHATHFQSKTGTFKFEHHDYGLEMLRNGEKPGY